MEDAAETTWHVLERRQPFARSLLWELQRRYFAARGVEAWRRGEVPHYVTSNPKIADSYAEIVFAFLGDRNRLAGAEEGGEPLHICELGAGSGRFAFHFLSRLTRLCEQSGMPPKSFLYVLTDQAESNLAFWRDHPRFQSFFASGLLETAVLDVLGAGDVVLRQSGRTITAGSLERPLAVIANYVFDSIPQDLFYIDGGECQECLVSLAVDAPPDTSPDTLDAGELLRRLRCHYDREPLAGPAYPEEWLSRILAGYRNAMNDTCLLFPAAGLRCLQRLAALSRRGLLLLSADKGSHRLAALQGAAAPVPVLHGSFSLSVNYHAIKMFCEHHGGLALFPEARHGSVDVNACLMVPDASEHGETRRAYRRHVEDFGPDDFYSITRHVSRTAGQMSAREALSYLRLACYDSHLTAFLLPVLTELVPELDRNERRGMRDALDRVWEIYFPLGEEPDLADGIARLLYAMGEYRRALVYFARSIEIYGEDTGTRANMAACRRMLGQPDS
jgi:hypothetical protein